MKKSDENWKITHFTAADIYYEMYYPLFPDFSGSGGDCQNFASQVLWFALGGDTDNGKLNTSWAPFDPLGSYTWYCKKGSWTSSWISCKNFRNYLTDNSRNANEPGLHGAVYNSLTAALLSDAHCGDIIYVSDGNHALSITYAPQAQIGEDDPRTVDTLYVSAHTTDNKNIQLRKKCGNALSSCMYAKIYYYL